MNILIVHNKYQIPGGEDVVVENEAAMLRKHGHKVVLYIRNNSELSEGSRLEKGLMYMESFFSVRAYRDICHLIRKKKIDVVHVHNTVHRISPSVFYAAVHMGVPVVQTLHNFRMVCPGATMYRNGHICEECIRCKFCYMPAISHACYRGSRLQTAAVVLSLQLQKMSGIWGKVHYICLTDFNKEKLQSLNRTDKKALIPASHIHVKPNFTPDPAADSASGVINKSTSLTETSETTDGRAAELLHTIGLSQKEKYYIALGRLERIKGTHLMVKAFARSGKTLVMVGTGEQEDAIRKYLEKHHITNIRLAGQLPHGDAMKLLSKAEALVICPQWYETFGMNVAEAFSLGIPVISNNVGNAASLVTDGVTGVKCENSASSLYQALERFEKTGRQALSDNAREEYEKKYSEEKNYALLMGIYDKVINRAK
ncbi:MAG: glycosyltransferase family 4 protein [Lachnospiraceae bacterium]|nr:glycosyltransferase family 4 protein [Lachnospiraceae bacterium]